MDENIEQWSNLVYLLFYDYVYNKIIGFWDEESTAEFFHYCIWALREGNYVTLKFNFFIDCLRVA